MKRFAFNFTPQANGGQTLAFYARIEPNDGKPFAINSIILQSYEQEAILNILAISPQTLRALADQLEIFYKENNIKC